MDTMPSVGDVPSLADYDEELWTELLGDYIIVWLRNTPQFIQEQKQKMLQTALCPFLFGVTYNVPLVWLDVLHSCGVIEKERPHQTTFLNETELEILEMSETIFNRCSQLVENKNDLKTILNFINDVEERSSLLERIDINYALQAVVDLEVFTSMWAPIKRIYDNRKRQAHVCIIYYFKIISQNVILYGCNGVDKTNYLKKVLSERNEAEHNTPAFEFDENKASIDDDLMTIVNGYSCNIKNDPLNSHPYSQRAQVFQSVCDYRSALCDYKRAILLDPHNYNHYMRAATSYLELNQLDKAEETNNQSLEYCKHPKEREAILQLSQEIRAKSRMTKVRQIEDSSGSEEREIDNVQVQYRRLVYEGSNYYQSKLYSQAMEQFKSAINLIGRSESEGPEIEQEELLVIWFVYGMSCVRTANMRNIQAGMEKLTAIISHSETFPAAYYGLGLAHMALKRYKDAEANLRAGLEQISEGKDAKVYHWPHSDNVVEETDPLTAKKLMSDMLQECLHPPKPDAICKFHTDSSKKEIYVSDLDYKGHICIKCRAGCGIEFHPQCWSVNDGLPKGKPNWKEMLDTACPTPGCWGLISDVFICRPDQEKSLKLSSQADPKVKTQANRPKLKMKTESTLKLERKLERKRLRKEKRQEAQGLKQEHEESEVHLQDTAYQLQLDDEEAARNIDRSGTLLIKDDPEVLVENKKLKASKLKKKEKKQKQFLTLDVQFKGDEDKERYGVNDLDDEGDFVNRPTVIVNPGLLPAPGSGLTTSTDASQTFQQSSLERLELSLYDFFFRLLSSKGPLDLFGKELEDETKCLSERAQSRIHDKGGIANFLSSDPRFSISPSKILSVAASTQHGAPQRAAQGNPWERHKSDESIRFINLHSLNPGAKEFVPQDIPSTSDTHSSDSTEISDSHSNIIEVVCNDLPLPAHDDADADGFTTVMKKKRPFVHNIHSSIQSDIYTPLRPASSYNSIDEIILMTPKRDPINNADRLDRDESENIAAASQGVYVSDASWNDYVEIQLSRDSPEVPQSATRGMNITSHGSDISDASGEDIHRVSSPALSTNSGSSSGRADGSHTSSQKSGQLPSLRPLKASAIVLPTRGKKKKLFGHGSSRLYPHPSSSDGNPTYDVYEEESVSSTTSDRDSNCEEPRVLVTEQSPLVTSGADAASSTATKENIATTNIPVPISRQGQDIYTNAPHQKTFEVENSVTFGHARRQARFLNEYMPSNEGLGPNFNLTNNEASLQRFGDETPHTDFQKEMLKSYNSDGTHENIPRNTNLQSDIKSLQTPIQQRQNTSRVLDQVAARSEKKVTFESRASPDNTWSTYNYFNTPYYATGNVRNESEVPSGDPWLKSDIEHFSSSSDEFVYRKGLVEQIPSTFAPDKKSSQNNAHGISKQSHHDSFQSDPLLWDFAEGGRDNQDNDGDPWSTAGRRGSQHLSDIEYTGESSLLSSFGAWDPPASEEHRLFATSAYTPDKKPDLHSPLTIQKHAATNSQSNTKGDTPMGASLSSHSRLVKAVPWTRQGTGASAFQAEVVSNKTAEAQTTLTGVEVKEMQAKLKMLKESQAAKELAHLAKLEVQEALGNCEKQLSREKAIADKLRQDVKKLVARVQTAEKLKNDLEKLAIENKNHLQVENQALTNEIQDLNNQLDMERLKSFNAQMEALELKCQVSNERLDAKRHEAVHHLQRLAKVIKQSEAAARALPDYVYNKHKEFFAYIRQCDSLKKKIHVNAQELKQDLIKGITVDLSKVEVVLPTFPQPPSEMTDRVQASPASGAQANVVNKSTPPSARRGESLNKSAAPSAKSGESLKKFAAPSAKSGESMKRAPKPAVQQEDSEDEDSKAYLSMFCGESRDSAAPKRRDGAAAVGGRGTFGTWDDDVVVQKRPDLINASTKPLFSAYSGRTANPQVKPNAFPGVNQPGIATFPGKRTPQPETIRATATPIGPSVAPVDMPQTQAERQVFLERILKTVENSMPGNSRSKTYGRDIKRDKVQQVIDQMWESNGGNLSGWTFEELATRVFTTILESEQNESQAEIYAPDKDLSKSASRLDTGDLQCSICQSEIEPLESLSLACGHKFHESCFYKWFKTDRSCPNCRAHTLLQQEFPTLK